MITVRKTAKGHRLFQDGKIARNKNGKPLDGGGHKFRTKALRQIDHINDGMRDEKRA